MFHVEHRGLDREGEVVYKDYSIVGLKRRDKMKLYQAIARTVDAYHHCVGNGNKEWEAKHREAIEKLLERLPSGSGWDEGTKIDLERSSSHTLVFVGAFHHMTESGFYNNWTDHTIIVTPRLDFGFSLKITGRGRDSIKEYLAAIFTEDLNQEIEGG